MLTKKTSNFWGRHENVQARRVWIHTFWTFSNTWSSVVGFWSQPVYSRGKSPGFRRYRRLCGLQSRPGRLMTQHSSFFTNVAIGVLDNGKLECTDIRATSSDITSYQVFFSKVSRLIQKETRIRTKKHVNPSQVCNKWWLILNDSVCWYSACVWRSWVDGRNFSCS
jgi:hypothetical protein